MDNIGSLSHLFVTLFLYMFAAFIVIPAITDVTMTALCPGQDECSLAIFLSGCQQAVIGLGMVVMLPIIGNLSDQYGRKALLTLPMTVSIIPLVILGYSRTTNFFYAYFVLRTLTAMFCEGSVNCLALAYVADNISEGKRASAFGILSGVTSGAFVCGTLAARVLSAAQAFQVAAAISMVSAVYMRAFLRETDCGGEAALQPILKGGPDDIDQSDGSSSKKIKAFKGIPSPRDLISMIKSSTTFSQAAVVTFFTGISDGGLQASLMYYLKARFHFSKNQFADIFLIIGVAGAISQLFLMPILATVVREEKLLSLGLFMAAINILLNSIAWSPWVPYAVSVLAVFVVFTIPCMRSIVSKQAGPNEQGKAQGCISGINSFANIIAPLIFSPLTAFFLSERAPFYFPGFSIMCIGLTSGIAFIQSMFIRAAPFSSHKASNNNSMEA